LKKTKEYIERTYYGITDPTQSKNLIKLNEFWNDLAYFLIHNATTENFLSENFIISNTNYAEMITVCAFLDLDFEGGQFQLEGLEGRRI
jgi:hypothetical protein